MKNFDNVVTVDKVKHANTRVKPNPDLGHAKELNVVAISLREIGACANNFPVVFIKNPETGKMRLVALFGFQQGENLFYHPKEWLCTYAPQILLRHPFIIGFDDRDPNGTSVTACLETDSPYLSDSEGMRLFDEEGKGTDFLNYHNRLLNDIFYGEKATDEFAGKLVDMGLIAPFDITLQTQTGEARRMTGLLTIDEKKLRALDKAQLIELTDKDYLANIYFMLNALQQFNQLVKIRNHKGVEVITGYQIEVKPQTSAA